MWFSTQLIRGNECFSYQLKIWRPWEIWNLYQEIWVWTLRFPAGELFMVKFYHCLLLRSQTLKTDCHFLVIKSFLQQIPSFYIQYSSFLLVEIYYLFLKANILNANFLKTGKFTSTWRNGSTQSSWASFDFIRFS